MQLCNDESCHRANHICMKHSNLAFSILALTFVWPQKVTESGILGHTGDHSGVSSLKIRYCNPPRRNPTMIPKIVCSEWLVIIVRFMLSIKIMAIRRSDPQSCQRIPGILVAHLHRRYATMVAGWRYVYMTRKMCWWWRYATCKSLFQ